METEKILIEDGTIENPQYDAHKRAKNWVAIVERDKSQPGGLRRTFLGRAPGGRVLVAGVEPGMWLEYAGDYYTASGRKSAIRAYGRVIEVNDHLTYESCNSDDVGTVDTAPPVNPLAVYSDEQLLAEIARRQGSRK